MIYYDYTVTLNSSIFSFYIESKELRWIDLFLSDETCNEFASVLSEIHKCGENICFKDIESSDSHVMIAFSDDRIETYNESKFLQSNSKSFSDSLMVLVRSIERECNKRCIKVVFDSIEQCFMIVDQYIEPIDWNMTQDQYNEMVIKSCDNIAIMHLLENGIVFNVDLVSKYVSNLSHNRFIFNKMLSLLIREKSTSDLLSLKELISLSNDENLKTDYNVLFSRRYSQQFYVVV